MWRRAETELCDDLPPCRTDPSRLEAAILNLIVNARDAAAPGRTGHVRIRTARTNALAPHAEGEPRHANGFVCISVIDDGVGMTERVRQQVLKPFFTTKGEAGTGLGLPQIDMFMRETGGKLRIESRPGAGTEIQLILPCETSDDATAQS